MADLDFKTVQERADDLVDNDQERVDLYERMREMFAMDWSGEPKADWIRKVVSPDAYDAAIGVMRLMMAAEPQITVASTTEEAGSAEEIVRDDQTERGLKAILRRSDRAREVAWVYDAALSATLFGEIVARVGNSADVAELSDNKVLQAQAQRVPFTIECLNPAGVFTEADAFGTKRVVITQDTTVGAVKEFWGKEADSLDGDDEDEIELYDYWDRTWRCVYVKGATDPIVLEKHELPFIPVIRKVVQGTLLWTRDEGHTVFPLLYAMYESGMWDAQNIALTMIYSIAYAMGSVPFLAVKKKSAALPDPEIDWSKPGINVELVDGVDLERIAMDAVPEEMLAVLNLVEGKVPEMLMPKVVFGQAPGATMAFSAINLLTQGGRLPLVPIQERLGDVIAAVCEVILRWSIDRAEQVEVWDAGALAKIDPARLDADRLWVDVRIEPDVPQDRMQVGTLVSQLVQSGVISRKTGREWMHILDDTAEQEQIIYERFVDKISQLYEEQGGGPLDIETLAAGLSDLAGEPGSGPLFDPSAGGLPPVIATGNPQAPAPGMPGGQMGGPGGEAI
jgi:hypothetical protein